MRAKSNRALIGADDRGRRCILREIIPVALRPGFETMLRPTPQSLSAAVAVFDTARARSCFEPCLDDPNSTRAARFPRPKPTRPLFFDRRRDHCRNLGIRCLPASEAADLPVAMRPCCPDRAASEFTLSAIRANDRGGLQLLRPMTRPCYRQARTNARDSLRACRARRRAWTFAGGPAVRQCPFATPSVRQRSDIEPALSTQRRQTLWPEGVD